MPAGAAAASLACDSCDDVIRAAPTFVGAYLLKAAALESRGMDDRLVGLLSEGLAAAPGNPPLLSCRSVAVRHGTPRRTTLNSVVDGR